MKKYILILGLILISTLAFSQKKDKIKGSKIVTVEQKKIENFESIEVNDNLEVFLVKGKECGVEIEADDNLHDAIEIVVTGSTLRTSTLKNAFGYKKLSIRITYTDDFKMVIAKNEAVISALAEINLDTITFKSFDYAKLYLNAKTKNFTLIADDKTTTELNLKSEKTTVSLTKNAQVKALINSTDLTFDMYQKSESTIEGAVEQLTLRLDNNSIFTGKKLEAKTIQVATESYSKAIIFASNTITIDATGKSEIQLFGDQKIEIKRFTDNAVLMKKSLK